MQMKKTTAAVVAAGAIVGAAAVGAATTDAVAAPAPHQQVQPSQTRPHAAVIKRPNYRPFVYRGERVTPRYDKHRHQWGFDYHRTWIVVTTR